MWEFSWNTPIFLCHYNVQLIPRINFNKLKEKTNEKCPHCLTKGEKEKTLKSKADQARSEMILPRAMWSEVMG